MGQFKAPFIHLEDSAGGGFVSQPLNGKWVSVLDPQHPLESPYGPIQPMAMGWPYWIFLQPCWLFSFGLAGLWCFFAVTCKEKILGAQHT